MLYNIVNVISSVSEKSTNVNPGESKIVALANPTVYESITSDQTQT